MEFSNVLIFGVDAELVPAAYLLRNVPAGERGDLPPGIVGRSSWFC